MLKRTKGRILLTMLVITGMAGTVRDNSLSTQQRKALIAPLREVKNELPVLIKRLNKDQLNFRLDEKSQTIREIFLDLVNGDRVLWQRLEDAMKQPIPSPADLITAKDNPGPFDRLDGKVEKKQARSVKSVEDALTFFKEMKAVQVKYIRTTTEDLQSRCVMVDGKTLDCQQLLNLIVTRNEGKLAQIHQIVADPLFPQK
jgi:hypothetical protein